MNPTHVGMNRRSFFLPIITSNEPHARGDEPDNGESFFLDIDMNPTHVGMNRRINRNVVFLNNEPHARGDEPELTASSVMLRE